MAKVSLAESMQEYPQRPWDKTRKIGPFMTISRQYGCHGFSLGLLLLESLNETTGPAHLWNVYDKEVLSRLATETELAEETIEHLQLLKPSLIVDFFRSLSSDKIPSGLEVRKRITTIIRGIAIQGYAIIVGQGGSAATSDLPNGLSIRLEAPEEWRIKQVSYREGLSASQAKRRIRAKEAQREYLRQLYEAKFPRKPAFHLTYDCSIFGLAQIAQHVVYAMKMLRYI